MYTAKQGSPAVAAKLQRDPCCGPSRRVTLLDNPTDRDCGEACGVGVVSAVCDEGHLVSIQVCQGLEEDVTYRLSDRMNRYQLGCL